MTLPSLLNELPDDAPRVLSACSGVGGKDLGFHRGGFRTVGLCEWDERRRRSLARHWPGVPIHPDLAELADWAERDPDAVREWCGGQPHVLIGGTPCFDGDTLILTRGGYLPIRDVEPGEEVLTHLGRWRRVRSTGVRAASESLRLRGQGVPDVLTTADHPFWGRRRDGEPEWTRAGAMPGAYAAQVLPPVVDNARSPDWWWLVGRYLADGWRVKVRGKGRVILCCSEGEADELAERIARVTHATRCEARTAVKYQVVNRDLYDFLAPFGHLAHGKRLTADALALPQAKAEALLDGWMTGDGWLRPNGSWRATTVSRELALGMALLAQRARGMIASIYSAEMPATCVIEGRTVNQRKQWQVDVPPRNRSAWIDREGVGWKLVRSAEPAGPRLVWNLEVEEDNSYVADGAAVHNCQDLSSAGRRAGLAGERSGLFFAFMRLRHALGIEWTVWENVRGALTSNGGMDFMEVLGAFVGAAVPLPGVGVGGAGVAAGPRGGCVWRLLNAQHFGVPQRRRRVFVVGRLGGECPPEVLLERVRGGRNLAARGAAGQVPPWAAAARAGGVGGPGLEAGDWGGGRRGDGGAGAVGHGFGGNGVAGTLGASAGGGRGHDARPDRGGALVAAAIAADATTGRIAGAGLSPKRANGLAAGRWAGSGANEGSGAERKPADGGVAPVDADGVRAADGVAGRVDGDVTGARAYTERTRNGFSVPEATDLPCLTGSTGRAGGGQKHLVQPTFVKRQDTPPALVAVPLAGDAGREGVARTPSADAEGRVRLRDPGLCVGEDGGPSYSVSAQGPPPSVFVSGAGEVGSCAVDPTPDGYRYAGCGDGVAAPQAHWIALRLGFVMLGEDPDEAWAEGRWDPWAS